MQETGHSSPQQPIICIVAPTAAGKTALAVSLARQFGGEVINADSRQIYRGMTIGTAKPSVKELAAVPHHLVDILDPHENFGLSLFLEHAREAVRDTRGRGGLPIVCGGTGQYVWGLVEGQRVPAVPPDPEFRAEMETEAERLGGADLYRRLAAIDPARAATLDPPNVRRVIRALEVHRATGRRPSELGAAGKPSADVLVLGLTMSREALYRRIDERVDRMMREGFLQEVQSLVERGYPMGKGPLDSPGYRELGQYLAGELSLDESIARAKTQTHRLARRQYAWFKLSDPRIRWLSAEDARLLEKASAEASAFLKKEPPVIQ